MRAWNVDTDQPLGDPRRGALLVRKPARERRGGRIGCDRHGRHSESQDADEAFDLAHPQSLTPTDNSRRIRYHAPPNAGEVLVSAAPGWEFVDLAGGHHSGGGSHGSLEAADSEVPMLTVGLGPPPASITGIKELVAAHFGVPVRRAI